MSQGEEIIIATRGHGRLIQPMRGPGGVLALGVLIGPRAAGGR